VTTPFYISPEQIMKDKADYARKGIARGRSVVVLQYDAGILFVAENPSRALHKVSEIYDRIAFAAVGKYNEFENLRIAGVRLADVRGYSYDRRDVTGRGLANAYAQTLGAIFSSAGEKPWEVEIVVAELGASSSDEDQIYRLTYDGSVADEHGYVVMGGQAEQISSFLEKEYASGLDLEAALRLAVRALGQTSSGQAASVKPASGSTRDIAAAQLEVAVLDRGRPQRKFRRIVGQRLDQLLGPAAGGAAAAEGDAHPVSEQDAGQPETGETGAGSAAPTGAAEPETSSTSAGERPPVGPEPPRPGRSADSDEPDEDPV
jgi:proteasome alpha subunit